MYESKKYREKSAIIEAIQFNGVNYKELENFSNMRIQCVFNKYVILRTLEGNMEAFEGDYIVKVGDYIVKNADGKFYHCKPDMFEKMYEEVEDVSS